MSNPRARLALALGLAASAVVGTAPPASAGLPVLARARIAVTTPTETTFDVCASGGVDDGVTVTGLWVFTLDGARSDTTTIREHVTAPGSAFGHCVTISTSSTTRTTTLASHGAWVATLSFVAAGSSDLTAVSVAVGGWSPTTGKKSVAYDT